MCQVGRYTESSVYPALHIDILQTLKELEGRVGLGMRAAYVMRLMNMCIVALLFGCYAHTTNLIHVVPRCSTVTTTIVWECCAVYKGTVTTVQICEREPWCDVKSKWSDNQPVSEV